jgi:hypothetical protein
VKGFGETGCILDTGDSDITALSGPGTSLLAPPLAPSVPVLEDCGHRSAYVGFSEVIVVGVCSVMFFTTEGIPSEFPIVSDVPA